MRPGERGQVSGQRHWREEGRRHLAIWHRLYYTETGLAAPKQILRRPTPFFFTLSHSHILFETRHTPGMSG